MSLLPRRHDDFDFFRGLVFACILSVPVWGLVIWLLWPTR